VIGAVEDIPRALEHPAVSDGRFRVEFMFAVDVERDEAGDLFARLSRVVSENGVEAMLLAGPIGHAAMRVVADVSLLQHCELLAVMPTDVFAEHRPVVVWTGDSPVVQLTKIPRRRWALAVKRFLDIVGSTVGLVAAAPIIALLSVAIRLESPGSPFFAHRRVGWRGRPFKCLKLRTMKTGAEELLRADPELYEEYRRNHFKLPEDCDPRTTRLGSLLRKTSLDELPQLWNVLRGEMSLVGPRPVVADELSMYEHSADLLLSVRPGLTGAWAVSGRHGVGYPRRCEIELAYIRNWRLVEDLRILLRTASVVALEVFRRASR
jgi:lipopolysaccharide/colanic/teichoic acid biosynthesis glycosyltransferase